jgi:hypothetical protein
VPIARRHRVRGEPCGIALREGAFRVLEECDLRSTVRKPSRVFPASAQIRAGSLTFVTRVDVHSCSQQVAVIRPEIIRDAEVVGSNPASPTKFPQVRAAAAQCRCGKSRYMAR